MMVPPILSSGAASAADHSSTSSSVSSRKKSNRKALRRRPMQDQRFSSYLSFGYQSTACLCFFFTCYVIVLLSIWPILTVSRSSFAASESDSTSTAAVQQQQHANSKNSPPNVKDLIHVPNAILSSKSQEKISAMAGAMKQKLQQFRKGRGATDKELVNQAMMEFQQLRDEKQLRKKRHEKHLQVVRGRQDMLALGDHRQGVIVLGMHRSGTSMLAGLLVKSLEYKVGGPLIQPAFDNARGFYERIDIVLQNDEFMAQQNIWWSANVINYDAQKALTDKSNNIITFKHGTTGLQFLNDPNNAPYLQKDPRMCITLKTWLPLLNNEPAILFTYRHPLEVAFSLKKREQNFPLERGLRLWIIYNMRAIQNSKGLCIVRSSNDALIQNPKEEVQRIVDELTERCNVVAPPTTTVTQDHVDEFVDPELQHNTKERQEKEEQKEVLETHNDGTCLIRSYESDYEEGTDGRTRELGLYLKAMRIYCDLQSGHAYDDDYAWPPLN